jgi:hypothetical protein
MSQKEKVKKNERFKMLYAYREYAGKEFDRLIVYFASGGLVFTTGFVKNIIDIKACTNTTLLKLTWIFFTFSLITILISHLSSKKSMDLEIKGSIIPSDRWDILTKLLNFTAFISLITGIVLFIVFLLKNI